MALYLQGPLVFHNNPPSAIRPKHRNRHVSSQIFLDSTGREHMLLNFYVQGKPPSSSSQLADSSKSYIEAIANWTGERVTTFSDLTFDEIVEWTKDRANNTWEKSKGAFRYLSGEPLPRVSLPAPTPADIEESNKAESSRWSFVGMFSGLRGHRTASNDGGGKRTGGEMWTEGEVHADLIRVSLVHIAKIIEIQLKFIQNDEGYFVFRYLLIDIPSKWCLEPITDLHKPLRLNRFK